MRSICQTFEFNVNERQWIEKNFLFLVRTWVMRFVTYVRQPKYKLKIPRIFTFNLAYMVEQKVNSSIELDSLFLFIVFDVN